MLYLLTKYFYVIGLENFIQQTSGKGLTVVKYEIICITSDSFTVKAGRIGTEKIK